MSESQKYCMKCENICGSIKTPAGVMSQCCYSSISWEDGERNIRVEGLNPNRTTTLRAPFTSSEVVTIGSLHERIQQLEERVKELES